MDYDYGELVNDFISDPSSAIERCKDIICSMSNFDSYESFYSYHLKNAHISTCQNSWSTPQISITCRDCANCKNSCLCLSCFLNGNHKGHDYIINANSRGNCDCGDFQLCKCSGFCSKHSGLGEQDKNPQDYLDQNLQILLTDIIFKAAFISLSKLTNDHTENAISIIQFISSFLKFGDGFRRLIAISLTEKIDLKHLMEGIIHYSKEFNQSFQNLCGSLINDQLFIKNFSCICYDVLETSVLKDVDNIIIHGSENVSYQNWNRFWFHCFNDGILKYTILQKKFQWVDFFCNILAYFKGLFLYVDMKGYKEFPDVLLLSFNGFKAAAIQPNEETQLFFDKIVEQILCDGNRRNGNNSTIITSFKEDSKILQYNPIFSFIMTFYQVFRSFIDKPNLKFDKIFEALDKNLDINPIFYTGKSPIGGGNGEENDNDNFVVNILNQDKFSEPISLTNYKSFHNGGAFFLSNLLVDSLAILFNNDNISKIKIARFLSSKKYQNLRVRLGISIMKTITSFVSYRQSIVAENNKSLKYIYKAFDIPSNATIFSTKYIPLFQLLIGLKCPEKTMDDEFSLKEFFAFEFAREFGLFDDFSSNDYDDENINEKQKQMLYSFLYMTLVFVCDRNLFRFDPDNFTEEQIIFALKQGVHSIDKLSKLYDIGAQAINNRLNRFNDVLMKVASTNRKENKKEKQENSSKSVQQEVLFYLKDDVKCNPISAINSLNKQMIIMNEEISKKPDELLKIPEYQSEEILFIPVNQTANNNNNDSQVKSNNDNGLNINLKQLLMTPTVMAIVYHTLRTSNGIDSPMSDLNDHLAMNILILIAKFIKEEKKDTQLSPLTITEINYISLHDLITKMKNEIYDFHAEKSLIENTLDQSNFVSLLNMKFSSNNLPPKSFIDVLKNKGKLGQEVLNLISLHVHLDIYTKQSNTTNDININKREKAKKLKEDIKNHFKNLISNYNVLDQIGTDSLDGIGSISNNNPNLCENEVCSICSTHKQNEILAYPLYIYRTKFPFIIDKPPMLKKDEVANEIEIDDNLGDIDIDIEEQEEEEIEDDKEEEREEEENDLIRILIMLLRKKKSSKKEKLKLNKSFKKQQKEENIEYKLSKEDQQFKRCTAGANFIIQFGICQHPVHPSCVNENVFTCPIDRSVKNGLLPCLDLIPKSSVFKNLKTFELNDIQDTLGESAINSITSFVEKFTSFFNNKPINIFIELIKSISGLISTYEIRLRSLVDCLDSDKTKFLSRNLFLTAWYSYRIQKKPNICPPDIEKRLTVFQRFIKRLIENDNIESDISEIVAPFINSNDSLKEKELYLFLRRVCLAEYFLLNNNDVALSHDMTNIIDWDEILSSTNLAERYKVKFTTIDENFEFKPFSFISLPKEFLRLSLKPFDLPIIHSKDVLLFNLLDYNYLINNYDEIKGEILENDEEINIKKNKKNLVSCKNGIISDILSIFYSKKHYPSVILFVGKYSSNAVVVDQDYYASFNPFYLDKYGCPDIGFKRSQPLFFNEERFDRLVDTILSGEFTNSLHRISDFDE